MPKRPRYQKIDLALPSGSIALYAGSKVRSAFEEVTGNMDLYRGVRLFELMEAVYNQGMKNGRREIIDMFDGLKNKVVYLPPGQPKKKRRR